MAWYILKKTINCVSLESVNLSRRSLLTASAAVLLTASCSSMSNLFRVDTARQARLSDQITLLEKSFDGRIGVALLDTGTNQKFSYRGNEHFPLLSTFKLVAAAAILQRSANAVALNQRIYYSPSELVPYSPITEKHTQSGMTLAELCVAALQYSDNTAGNLLLKQLNGPAGLTQFARRIGDYKFRLDRWETELNSALPGDLRDTTTPDTMCTTMQQLLVSRVLQPWQQQQLIQWLLGNTTGDKRIRAGVPAGWQVGDKTGTGEYGTANDVAILFPSDRSPPLILAIYTTQHQPNASPNNQIIADVARLAVQ